VGRQRFRGRNVNGILLFDKPKGITSNAALQQVKRLFKASKAGHTGSLDPLADGLLPICFGAATKVSAYLLDADKRYSVRIQLGVTTTTADSEGEVIETLPVDQVTEQAIQRVLPDFKGKIQQLPPMYSALKHNGQRLYKLAREGIEVEREPRDITIYSLTLEKVELPFIDLQVHCSKGTYVRTLAEDIGKVLGCGAHVVGLRRTSVGPYGIDHIISMDELEVIAGNEGLSALDALLLPLDSALQSWPEVHLTLDASHYLKMGQSVLVPKAPTEGWVRIYGSANDFIGVGQVEDDGRIAPKRLLMTGS